MYSLDWLNPLWKLHCTYISVYWLLTSTMLFGFQWIKHNCYVTNEYILILNCEFNKKWVDRAFCWVSVAAKMFVVNRIGKYFYTSDQALLVKWKKLWNFSYHTVMKIDIIYWHSGKYVFCKQCPFPFINLPPHNMKLPPALPRGWYLAQLWVVLRPMTRF